MRRFLKIKALLLASLTALAVLMVLPSLAFIARFDLNERITRAFPRRFQLGLDLQGGLHIEYSVAVDEAIENKLDQIASELEAAFKEKKSVEVTAERVGLDQIHLRFATPADVATATDDVMAITYGSLERITDVEEGLGEADGVIRLKMPDTALAENRKMAVSQALDTVRRRVDAMGVAEPNIYPKNRQIVVELPGLSDTATELRAAADDAARRIVEVLRERGVEQAQVASLQGNPGAFELATPGKDAPALLQEAFGSNLDTEGSLIDDRLPAELVVHPDDPGKEPDPTTVRMGLSESARDKVLEESSDFRRLLKVIERAAVLEWRLIDDETPFGDTGKPYLQALYEAGLVRQGLGISVNLLPGYGEEAGYTIPDYYAFYAKDRDTLERFFGNLPRQWRLPSTHMVAFGREPVVTRRSEPPEYLWRTWVVKSRAEVTGSSIVNADVGFDPQTGTPEVDLKLDRIGAERFEQMSGENVGRKSAIMLDDAVQSDPKFRERIGGGNVRITLGDEPGKSVREVANDLVKILKSGSLPARLQKEFEIRVGADLGKEAVESGFLAFVVGLVAVVLFMGVYYRRAGTVAVFALVLNVGLILAAMAFFQATLTLPGIAGIVLTLGMAVDANVIVNERIREYLREGYTARAAVEAGYDRAFTTILDSQLTTAIAGLVLLQYGSGPIRGFAVTLLIGIATSIFTAVWCTRLFFDFQTNRRGFDRVSV